MSTNEQGKHKMKFKDPAIYSGEFVCACCGSGWPLCGDTRPDGTSYTHAETCQKYIDSGQWSDDYRMCGFCENELITDLGPSC